MLLKLRSNFCRGYRSKSLTGLTSRQSCFQRVDPSFDYFNVSIDGSVNADMLVAAAPVPNGDRCVDIHPDGRQRPCGKLIDGRTAIRAPIELIRIELFEGIDHSLIQFSVTLALLKERRELLMIEVILHSSRFAIDTFG